MCHLKLLKFSPRHILKECYITNQFFIYETLFREMSITTMCTIKINKMYYILIIAFHYLLMNFAVFKYFDIVCKEIYFYVKDAQCYARLRSRVRFRRARNVCRMNEKRHILVNLASFEK